MKKSLQIISLLALASSAMSITVDDLQIPDTVKQQMKYAESVQKSINEYVTSKLGSGFATVGSAAQCDYHLGSTLIQDAIDAGETELRLVDETFDENIIIDDISITINGGYVDCAAAQAGNQSSFSSHSNIRGLNTGTNPTITITGNSQVNTIKMSQVNITNGNAQGTGGGGIKVQSADADITLENVDIFSNIAEIGGGIGIFNSRAFMLLFDTQILLNSAKDGGAIYCQGSPGGDTGFLVSGSSSLSNNTAGGGTASQGKGGALYLKNKCTYANYSTYMYGNISSNNGGAIFASSGAKIILNGHQMPFFFGTIGNDTSPASLINNTADSNNTGAESGGGAYITGADTELTIYAGLIKNNKSGSTGNFSHGGGIALADGAKLTVDRLKKECWSQEHCNYFDSNKSSTTNGYGGAIYNDDSTVEITSAVFANNRADYGTAIYGITANSKTTVKGSLFHHNGNNGANDFLDNYIFRVIEGAEIDIEHSTIADNDAEISVLGVATNAGGVNDLQSSIVHDASTGPVYNSTTASLISNDCLIVHESSSFTPSASTVIDDPEFVDRVNYDFHIASISPAIDYCDAFFTDAENYKDIDFEDRGWDDPTVPGSFDPTWFYDIGVDETYSNDIIFKNGFE